MNQSDIMKNLHDRTAKAVAHYWGTRSAQRKKQEQSGKADQGLRSAVTGGAQMDGFIDFFKKQNCLAMCDECNYCAKWAKKVVSLDKEEVIKIKFKPGLMGIKLWGI